MHSIERYGVASLLLLVVTVIAVLVFNDDVVPTTRTARAAEKAPREAMRKPDGRRGSRTFGSPVSPAARGEVSSPPVRRTPGTREAATLGGTSRGLSRGSMESNRIASGEEALASRRAGIVPSELSQRGAAGAPATASALPLARGEGGRNAQQSTKPRAEPVAAARPRGTRKYTIRPGDTLSEIAMNELGTMKRWREILDMNPGLDPALIRVGQIILLPASAGGVRAPKPGTRSATASKPKLAARAGADQAGTYLVREGDSLWKISANLLGDGGRWGEIASLNTAIDVNRLHPGMILRVPAGAKVHPIQGGETVAASLETSPRGRVR